SGAVVGPFHPRDLAGVGDDRVLAARLPRLRAASRTTEGLPLEHLEQDLVDVDRVGVLGEVVQLPDLGRAQCRVLGDPIVPPERDALVAGNRPQECKAWPERLALGAVEDDVAVLVGADPSRLGVLLVPLTPPGSRPR